MDIAPNEDVVYPTAAKEQRRRREAEQRRVIVETAANGMLVIDGTGIIELANAEAERIFGYAAGALTGVPVDVLESVEIGAALKSPPTVPIMYDPLHARAFGGDLTGRCRDGSTISIDIVPKLIPTDSGRLMLISVMNSEERLRLAQRRPALGFPIGEDLELPLIAQSPTVLGRWRLDLLLNELWWSDEMFRIYGVPFTNRPTFEEALAVYDAGDRDRVRTLRSRAITEGTAYRDEARIVRPNGMLRHVILTGEAQFGPDGKPIAVTGTTEDVTEQRNAQALREQLSQRVSAANQAGKVGMWELDLRTKLSAWDKNMFQIYGLQDSTTVPSFELWNATVHPHDRDRAGHEIKDDIARGGASDSEFRVIWENGEVHNIRSLASVVCDAMGVPARIIGTDWDVTEVRTLAAQLRAEKEALVSSEARYRALTEAMPQMVWVIDADAQFEYVNDRWSQYTGLSLERSRAAGPAAVIDVNDASIVDLKREALPAREFECEMRLRRADGVYRWHLVRTVPFHDMTGDAGKWIVTATDIEERKSAEKILATTVAELDHLAHHDSMTNLPNRMLLMNRLTKALTVAKRAQTGVIVLYLDLDGFKWINDTFGHAAGDCVLAQTGIRISSTLRTGDTAGRVGGDEFIVVCATSDADEAAQIAERLIAAVGQPIDVAGEIVAVEASIGISIYPADDADAEGLIRKADAAMYSAKQSGRNTFRRYSTQADVSIVAAADFEAELRAAIALRQFVVHYQPIFSSRSHRPTGAEALVRWEHPRRGLLQPNEFIPFAEERGLVAQIGAIVLHAVCEQISRLQLRAEDDFSIAINVSARQFDDVGFVEGIINALALHGTDARRLAFEITESVVMGKTQAAIETLHELRALGAKLSIDDFGTGYSSLAYIKNFPVHTLKIDRSFVRDIAKNPTDQAIAKTIITLAHSLGMVVVAEGVETRAQFRKVQSFGANKFQGFLFSRPLASAKFERYMQGFAAPVFGRLA